METQNVRWIHDRADQCGWVGGTYGCGYIRTSPIINGMRYKIAVAINVVFPRTVHAFDLLLPHISPLSPPAQSALYDVDRFLALLLNKD